LTVMQKLKKSLETFWAFIEKLAPYKEEDSFQTEQHFQLEQKVFLQMQPLIQQVIEDGIRTKIFDTNNSILASEFILSGLSGIAHSRKLNFNDGTKKEMTNLVLTTLKYNQIEGI